MALSFGHVTCGPLRQVHAAFDAGRHVVLGMDGAGLDLLVGLAAGDLAPERGRVDFGGAAPFSSPSARRSIGALRAHETLPTARNVERALGFMLEARGSKLAAKRALEHFGLEAWSSRSVAALNMAEIRGLMLVAALTDEAVKALVLYEPLASALSRSAVIEALSQTRAELVVSMTSSLDDARSLNATWWMLDQGKLTQTSGAAVRASMRGHRALRIRSKDARAIAAEVARNKDIVGIEFDESRSPTELLIHAEDVLAAARGFAQAATQVEASVDAVELESPSLEAVLSARRSMLEVPYTGAQPPPPAPAPVAWGSIAYPGAATPYGAPSYTPDQSASLPGGAPDTTAAPPPPTDKPPFDGGKSS